jgi:hypothetical protein
MLFAGSGLMAMTMGQRHAAPCTGPWWVGNCPCHRPAEFVKLARAGLDMTASINSQPEAYNE